MLILTKITVIVSLISIQAAIQTTDLYLPLETLIKKLSSDVKHVACTGTPISAMSMKLLFNCNIYDETKQKSESLSLISNQLKDINEQQIILFLNRNQNFNFATEIQDNNILNWFTREFCNTFYEQGFGSIEDQNDQFNELNAQQIDQLVKESLDNEKQEDQVYCQFSDQKIQDNKLIFTITKIKDRILIVQLIFRSNKFIMILLCIFFISNFTLQQTPCKQGCLRCISEQKCLFCDIDNNYILSGNECVTKELDLCQKIDIYGKCLLCQKNHYIDESTQKCVAILPENLIQNCYQYQTLDICNSCDSNYYLRDNTCTSVGTKIDNCLFYSSSQQCIQCSDGYVLSYDEKCLKIEDCILYAELECLQCNTGYFLNKNYHLQSIFELSHSNQSLKLQELLKQQYKNVQKANICQPYLDQNCLIYKNEKDCLECKDGYFMDSNKKCQSFPLSQIANCEEYQSLSVCKKCAQKYLLVNSQCLQGQEIPNCVLYKGDTATQTCIQCDFDYYLKSNYCIQRELSQKIENCQILQQNEDLCEQCEDDYILSIDQLKCFLKIAGCHENGYGALYSTNNKVTCYQCQTLHYLEDGACKSGKISNCLIYHDSENCSECKEGYYFNQEDQQCQSQKNIQNCREYSKLVKDVCVVCQNMYFNFLIKNECKQFQKIENCLEYSSYDPVKCKTCKVKYNLIDNQCQIIELTGCLKLQQDGESCELCEQGYALNQGNCVSPPIHTVENCQQNSTQEQSNSSFNLLDVKCNYCKSDSFPIDMKYRYICMEDEYIETQVNSVITDCIKYKGGKCIQCGNNKFLYNDDCIDNCTKYMRLYFHVQNHNIYDSDLSNRSGNISYIRYNKCLSISNSETCEIMQHDVYLEQQGCIKCRSGYHSIFDQTPKTNAGSLIETSLPSYVSFYYYSNIDPNRTQMPFINDIGFVSPFLECKQFSNSDFPVNECRYYYRNSNSESYTCLSCNKGFIGLIEQWKSQAFTKKYDNQAQNINLQVSKITQCIPYNSIQSNQCTDTYYTNLEPLWEALFSCHVCKAANQIPFLITKFNSLDDLSNMYYRTYDLNNGEDWGDGNNNHTIQCKEKKPEFFGYDPNSNELTDQWFQLPEECAMAVVNISIDTNSKSHKDLIINNGEEKFLPIFCAACNPGYSPIYYSQDLNNRFYNLQIFKCKLIENCIGRQWVNSCSKCKSGFAFKMPSLEGTCSNKNDCTYEQLQCVPSPILDCFEINAQNQCISCNKGYTLNESSICEKIVPPKCESSDEFVLFVMQKNYLSYKFESYIFQQGQGCSKCQQGYKSIYNTDFFINCYQSKVLEDFNSKINQNLSNGITNCQGYTQSATSQTSNEDIYEGNDQANWPQASRQIGTYKCEKCSQDTLLNFSKSECLADLDFCIAVDAQNRCSKCQDTHALQYSGDQRTCLQGNIKNCSRYKVTNGTSNVYCIECSQGYRFEDDLCVEGQVANCLVYEESDEEECLKCADNYILIEDLVGRGYCYPIQETLQCKKGFMINDSTYGAVLQCIECVEDDQYISFKDQLETMCMPYTEVENCSTYKVDTQLINSNFQCTKCEEKFYLDSNGNCKERQKLDSHCEVYSIIDICDQCEKNYFLDEDKCKSYPVGIAGCLEYKDQTTCISCKEKMFLFEGTCVDVPIQNLLDNCLKYTNASVCQECENGYFLNSKGSFCYPATAQNCLVYRSRTECEVCIDGYGFVEDGEQKICQEVKVDNCTKFKQIDPYDCLICEEGYFLNEGFCEKVLKKIVDCHEYLTADTCGHCEENTIITEKEDQCLSDQVLEQFIPENCETSKKKDNLVCLICPPGQYFVNDECQSCQAQNCMLCDTVDSSVCFLCNSGSYMNDKGQCIQNNGINPQDTVEEVTENVQIYLTSLFVLIFNVIQLIIVQQIYYQFLQMNFLGYGMIMATFIWALFNHSGLLSMYGLILGFYTLMYFIKNRKAKKLVRRKIQIASWEDVGDPTVYGQIEFDMTSINKFIEKNKAENPKSKLKKIHFAIRAVGQMHLIKKSPFGFISFGVFRKSQNLDVCVVKKMTRENFEYFVIRKVEQKSVSQIAEEYETKMKSESRKLFDYRNFQFLKFVPHFILDSIFAIMNFVSYDLGLPILGYEPNNFGSIVLYDLTESGIHEAIFPLPKISKITSVFTFCAPEKKARQNGDDYEIYEAMNSTTSFDHRHGDGSQGLHMKKSLMEVMNNPEKYFQQLMNQNLETKLKEFFINLKSKQTIHINNYEQIMNVFLQNSQQIDINIQKDISQLLTSCLFLLRNNSNFFEYLTKFYSIVNQYDYLLDEAYFLIISFLECQYLITHRDQCLDIFILFFGDNQKYLILFLELLLNKNEFIILSDLFLKTQKLKKNIRQEINKNYFLVYFQKINEFQNLKFSLELISKTIKLFLSSEITQQNKMLRIIQLGLQSFDYQIQKLSLEVLILNQKFYRPALIVLMLQKQKFYKNIENLDKERKLITLYQGNLINTLESDFPLIRYQSLNFIKLNIPQLKNDQILKVQSVVTDFFIDEDFKVRLLSLDLDQLIKNQQFDDTDIYLQCYKKCLLHYDYLIQDEHFLIREQIYKIISQFKIQTNKILSLEIFQEIVKMFKKVYKQIELNYLEKKFIMEYFFYLLENNLMYRDYIYKVDKQQINKSFIYAEDYQKNNYIEFYYAFYIQNLTSDKLIFSDQKYIKRQLKKASSSKIYIQQNYQFEFIFDQFLTGNCQIIELFQHFHSLRDFLYNMIIYFQNLKFQSKEDLQYFIFNKDQWQKEKILKICCIVYNELQIYKSIKILITLILQIYTLLNPLNLRDNKTTITQYYSVFNQFYPGLNKNILKKDFQNFIENKNKFQSLQASINQLQKPIVKQFKDYELFFERKSYAFLQNSYQEIYFYISNYDNSDRSVYIQANDKQYEIKKVNQASKIFNYKVSIWIDNNNSFTMDFFLIRKISDQFHYNLSPAIELNFQKKYTINQYKSFNLNLKMERKKINEEILNIIKKQQKTFEDIQFLYENFQHLRFFNKLVKRNMKSIVFELLSKMKCQNYDENEVVFKEGSIACNFYTILSGEVYVLIKNTKTEQNKIPNEDFKNKYLNDIYMFDQTNKNFKHQIIREMSSGDVFGELGILNGSSRLATICTKTKVVFGIIGTEDFKSIIKSSVFKAIDQKFKFFENLLNKNFQNTEIQQISAYFQSFKFKQDNIIEQENKNFSGVWFIASGEIVLKKKLKNFTFKTEEKQILFNKNQVKYQMINQKVFQQDYVLRTQQFYWVLRNYK